MQPISINSCIRTCPTFYFVYLTFLVLYLAATPSFAGLALPENQSISISAASNVSRDKPRDKGINFTDGVYVAYAEKGLVEFISPDDKADYKGLFRFSLQNRFKFTRPSVIAEEGGTLYVWDAAERALIAFDPYTGQRRIVTRDQRLESPQQIIASPEGYLLIFDNYAQRVFWLKDVRRSENLELREARELSNLFEPRSAAFLTWDTLAVLDGAKDTILIYGIGFSEERLYIKPIEDLPLGQRSRAKHFTAITAQDGALYVADSERIYTYIIDSRELIPATPSGMFDDIRAIEASHESLFVIDGREIKAIPKTIPVELELSAPVVDSQTALLKLYLYLDRTTLLPTKRQRTLKHYETLSEFLLEQGVFLTPRNIAVEKEDSWFGGAQTSIRKGLAIPQQEFGYWLCRRNRKLCATSSPETILFSPIAKNTSIIIPLLDIRSKLRRQRVELNGTTVEEMLSNFVLSPQHQNQLDYTLFKKLNKNITFNDKSEFYALSKGEVYLPHETWSVLINVPAADYYDRESELYRLSAAEGINIYGLDLYSEQSAMTHRDSGTLTGECKAIHDAHSKMMADVHYPDKAFHSNFEVGLQEFNGVVGVVEKRNQLDRDHTVFFSNNQAAWYTVGDFDELIPDTVPHSLGNPEGTTGNFVKSKHHATHVAALIGGRNNLCWEGLLPNAKLVLADISSDIMRKEIRDAISAGVKVFNISHGWKNLPEIEERKRRKFFTINTANTLYVVAAGQVEEKTEEEGKNLDIEAEALYPAVWGNRSNIITTTYDSDKANYGKRYVDITTRGLDIMSATEDHFFAATSGTSQATPIVTAAAAYLADPEAGGHAPGDVKARLIATADWKSTYKGKVWGGSLNFKDAVQFYNQTVFKRHIDDDDEIFSVAKPNSRNRVGIANYFEAYYYPRTGIESLVARTLRIMQGDIISLRKNKDDTHRVVFKDRASGELKIIINAELEGKLEFKRGGGARKFNYESRQFEAKPDQTLHFEGQDGIDFNQIEEYFRSMPYDITW